MDGGTLAVGAVLGLGMAVWLIANGFLVPLLVGALIVYAVARHEL